MAKRRPEFVGKPIPVTPQALPPDAPSAEKLADKAKELRDKPRRTKPGKGKESAEEISQQLVVAEHFALAESMARDTVDIVNIGMSQMDSMYDAEIQYVLKERREKLTFEFNKTEAETVGNACYSLYKKVDPARLAAIGGWMTGLALVATVLLPRMKLASELRKLREDLAEKNKLETERQNAPAAPASDSRTPGAAAPSPVGIAPAARKQ